MTQQPRNADVAFAREKAKRTLPISLLVLLGIIAMYQPLPKRFVALLPLVVAVVLSVRLLTFLRGREGREKVWPTVTLLLIGLLISNLAVQALFYDTVRSYDECVRSAQTQQAAAACEEMRKHGPLRGGLLLE